MTSVDKPQNNTFVFRKHDSIGSAAAEEDVQFLEECFVDTGDLEQLIDCKNPRRIIVGRTGAGKSALLVKLRQRSRHVIELSPHSLALNFIANNNVISFFEAAGVNLSVFYNLLWRHILVVELLKNKFNIVNEDAHKDYMRQIRSILYKKDRIKEQAVDYLEKWGDKFWLTTEERIHELTEKIESKLSGSVGGELIGVKLNAEGARTLTTEQKKEVVERGRQAVSEVQIRELENMIAVLSDNVFNDSKDHYYVTIDMLDEEWADDRIRFKLIRALIDTIRHFRKVENVKIIAVLRQDLLNKILRQDPTPGFQEEKYESLYLNIQWAKKELHQLIERRINHLIRRRYTKGDVTFNDVFPSTIDKEQTISYLCDRTFLRPRDIILFVNDCLQMCEGRISISGTIIKQAEEGYSRKRLQSLASEWHTIFPNLAHVAQLFYGAKCNMEVSEFTKDLIEERYSEIVGNILDTNADPITRALDTLYTQSANFNSVRSYILRELYVTGLIGIKTGPSSSTSWSYMSMVTPSLGEIRPSSTIHVHPMFYRALGIAANCRQ
jgi:hypothetical protein